GAAWRRRPQGLSLPLRRRRVAARRRLARGHQGPAPGVRRAAGREGHDAMTTLKTAIATYPHTKALKDGSVTAGGLKFDHVEVSPIVAAFRRMVRTLEFDVSEMAITTYLTAKAPRQGVHGAAGLHHAPVPPRADRLPR